MGISFYKRKKKEKKKVFDPIYFELRFGFAGQHKLDIKSWNLAFGPKTTKTDPISI